MAKMKTSRVNRFLRLTFILRLATRLGWRKAWEAAAYRLCSQCFSNEGLRLSAEEIGLLDDRVCPNCRATDGRKLTKDLIDLLAYRFFVWGTLHWTPYGAAPLVQFNNRHPPDLVAASALWPEEDMRIIERVAGIGFFLYGPRLWMIGLNIEPLDALQDPMKRAKTLQRICNEYPDIVLPKGHKFFRLRKNLERPEDFNQYDSPPIERTGCGRLDSEGFPVMYASQNLPICIHECRVAAEDEVFVATLATNQDLKLLDLTELLLQSDKDEFESLDMAVHMLSLAGKHSYNICRAIVLTAAECGYDGLVYPSYFSLLHMGKIPFETTFGMSHRTIPKLAEREKSKIISNLALFGRPVEQGKVEIRSINRLVLRRVQYDAHFGPVGLSASCLS